MATYDGPAVIVQRGHESGDRLLHFSHIGALGRQVLECRTPAQPKFQALPRRSSCRGGAWETSRSLPWSLTVGRDGSMVRAAAERGGEVAAAARSSRYGLNSAGASPVKRAGTREGREKSAGV